MDGMSAVQSRSTLGFFIWVLVSFGAFVTVHSAPAACRWCKGNCSGTVIQKNNQTLDGFNQSLVDYDMELILSLVDQDTNITNHDRNKRESTLERRPCEAKLQLELFLIPLSIFMIPVALCGLLLCVCFCGPKETRGKLPEKMWGMKFAPKRVRHDTEDELDYGPGYVQRKDSKKTRFATNVSVIERRRDSAITVDSNSPRPMSLDPTKRTRFNRQVAVIDENEDSVQMTRL